VATKLHRDATSAVKSRLGHRQSGVADHLHLSGAFVTTITNKLLKRGLIHKSIDPQDRRRVKLQVSEKGMRSWPSLPRYNDK
jgi:DNA-binding MarR family transcriptional regulator